MAVMPMTCGACPECQRFFSWRQPLLTARKTANAKVLKIDIPSVTDVNENKKKTNMLADEKLTNQHFFTLCDAM